VDAVKQALPHSAQDRAVLKADRSELAKGDDSVLSGGEPRDRGLN
jgi:hypothetical protein